MIPLIILVFKMGKRKVKKIMIYLIMKNYSLKENQKRSKMFSANQKLSKVKAPIQNTI